LFCDGGPRRSAESDKWATAKKGWKPLGYRDDRIVDFHYPIPSCFLKLYPYPIWFLFPWFPKFFWSRTTCGSHTVSTYHLVPGKVNVPNIIRSKVWKQFRH